jgi:hypothetical protein
MRLLDSLRDLEGSRRSLSGIRSKNKVELGKEFGGTLLKQSNGFAERERYRELEEK